jgi:hypothetical protein
MAVTAARKVTFVILAAFILLEPAYARVTDQTSSVVQRWDMFHRRGVGVCDAEFLDGTSTSLVPLDRFAILSTTRQAAPRIVRRMDGEEDVDDVARRLCHAMGRGADVRVRARCATPEGWRATHAPSVNACRQAREGDPPSAPSKASDDD